MQLAFLKNKKVRKNIVIAWFVLLAGVFALYFLEPTFFHTKLKDAVLFSPVLGYGLYLLLGCLRGFTLIPSTSLILLGMLFFPPWPLFVLTLLGILASSASVYYFSDYLQLDELFETTHALHLERVKNLLRKYELPIIIGWSFFPLAPTDIVCYACGTFEINFPKFLLGILIGEGTICALYIFAGELITSLLHFI